MRGNKKFSKEQNKNFWERVIAIITAVTIIVAAVIGFNKSIIDISPLNKDLVKDADRFEQLSFEKYAAFNDSIESPIAYITVADFNGFGGPLKSAVSVDRLGNILNIKVVEHKETPSWFQRVMDSQVIDNLIGKNYKDEFALEKDVDGLTGATYTTRALVECAKIASLNIAHEDLKLSAPKIQKQYYKFGLPEISLIFLLLVGTFGYKYTSQNNKKRVRWLSLITGMVFIGFMYNHPLTLVDINKFLMGYWPDLHHQIYWYILIFGVLLIFLTTNKNVYCNHICPFGAAQDCLALVAKAKAVTSKPILQYTKWLRRSIVWVAVILALIFRNPGFSSYEIYSTLFTLSGTNSEVFFLGIIIAAALFIKRPWCKFLCPVPAFEEYLRLLISYIKQKFNRLKLEG